MAVFNLHSGVVASSQNAYDYYAYDQVQTLSEKIALLQARLDAMDYERSQMNERVEYLEHSVIDILGKEEFDNNLNNLLFG